jgi:hypothetical protein
MLPIGVDEIDVVVQSHQMMFLELLISSIYVIGASGSGYS